MARKQRITRGTLLYCNPFPDWTNAEGISAHFVLVLRVYDNGNLMLAPITSKGSRCRVSLSLTSDRFPSLFGPGCLSIEGSHLSLRDDTGCTTVYIWPVASGALTPANGSPIPVDWRACLSESEMDELLNAMPETLRSQVGVGPR